VGSSSIRVLPFPPSIQEITESSLVMLHIGRAWFPVEYEAGRQYWHSQSKSDAESGNADMFSRFGKQVWCKCNYTAADIIPWPLPTDIDFQSFHTLSILYHARTYFGALPKTKFRMLGKHTFQIPYL
jgi:hypothetical protein